MYHRLMGQAFGILSCTICMCISCGNNANSHIDEVVVQAPSVPEKICGASRDEYFSAYTVEQLSAFADCTVLVGQFQEDSVTELKDFAALGNVRKIEGMINVFRSSGFVTLHGLENLEEVDGNLYIHLNGNLESLSAFANLRTVTGNLYIGSNDLLPQSEVVWLGARVTVGGTKKLE
jgi:hypothetical protein